MKFENTFVHPTFASFMREKEPEYVLSEETMEHARRLHVDDSKTAFFVRDGILHLWFDQEVHLNDLARAVGMGLTNLQSPGTPHTPRSYGVIVEQAVMLLERLRKAGRI